MEKKEEQIVNPVPQDLSANPRQYFIDTFNECNTRMAEFAKEHISIADFNLNEHEAKEVIDYCISMGKYLAMFGFQPQEVDFMSRVDFSNVPDLEKLLGISESSSESLTERMDNILKRINEVKLLRLPIDQEKLKREMEIAKSNDDQAHAEYALYTITEIAYGHQIMESYLAGHPIPPDELRNYQKKINSSFSSGDEKITEKLFCTLLLLSHFGGKEYIYFVDNFWNLNNIQLLHKKVYFNLYLNPHDYLRKTAFSFFSDLLANKFNYMQEAQYPFYSALSPFTRLNHFKSENLVDDNSFTTFALSLLEEDLTADDPEKTILSNEFVGVIADCFIFCRQVFPEFKLNTEFIHEIDEHLQHTVESIFTIKTAQLFTARIQMLRQESEFHDPYNLGDQYFTDIKKCFATNIHSKLSDIFSTQDKEEIIPHKIAQTRIHNLFSDSRLKDLFSHENIKNNARVRNFLLTSAHSVPKQYQPLYFSHPITRMVFRYATPEDIISDLIYELHESVSSRLIEECFSRLTGDEKQIFIETNIKQTIFKENPYPDDKNSELADDFVPLINQDALICILKRRFPEHVFKCAFNMFIHEEKFFTPRAMTVLAALFSAEDERKKIFKAICDAFFQNEAELENVFKYYKIRCFLHIYRDAPGYRKEIFEELSKNPIFWNGSQKNETAIAKMQRFLFSDDKNQEEENISFFMSAIEKCSSDFQKQSESSKSKDGETLPSIELIERIASQIANYPDRKEEIGNIVNFLRTSCKRSMMEQEKYSTSLTEIESPLSKHLDKITFRREPQYNGQKIVYRCYLHGHISEENGTQTFTIQGSLENEDYLMLQLFRKNRYLKIVSQDLRTVPPQLFQEIHYIILHFLEKYYTNLEAKKPQKVKTDAKQEENQMKDISSGQEARKDENEEKREKREKPSDITIQPSRAKEYIAIDIRDKKPKEERHTERKRIISNQELALDIFIQHKKYDKEIIEGLILYEKSKDKGRTIYLPLEAKTALDEHKKGLRMLDEIYVRDSVAHTMALGYYSTHKTIKTEAGEEKTLYNFEKPKSAFSGLKAAYELLAEEGLIEHLDLSSLRGYAVITTDKNPLNENLARTAQNYFSRNPEIRYLDEELEDITIRTAEKIKLLETDKTLTDDEKAVRNLLERIETDKAKERIEEKKKKITEQSELARKKIQVGKNQVVLAQPGNYQFQRTFNQGSFISIEELSKKNLTY